MKNFIKFKQIGDVKKDTSNLKKGDVIYITKIIRPYILGEHPLVPYFGIIDNLALHATSFINGKVINIKDIIEYHEVQTIYGTEE